MKRNGSAKLMKEVVKRQENRNELVEEIRRKIEETKSKLPGLLQLAQNFGISVPSVDHDVIDEILSARNGQEFKERLSSRGVELCRIYTLAQVVEYILCNVPVLCSMYRVHILFSQLFNNKIEVVLEREDEEEITVAIYIKTFSRVYMEIEYWSKKIASKFIEAVRLVGEKYKVFKKAAEKIRPEDFKVYIYVTSRGIYYAPPHYAFAFALSKLIERFEKLRVKKSEAREYAKKIRKALLRDLSADEDIKKWSENVLPLAERFRELLLKIRESYRPFAQLLYEKR